MLSSASLIGAVVSAVLALGPVSAPTKGTDRADEPSHPVMIALTTSTGSPTELASAGLDKLPLSSGQASGRPLNPLNLWLSEQNDAKKSSAATPSAKEGRKENLSAKEGATEYNTRSGRRVFIALAPLVLARRADQRHESLDRAAGSFRLLRRRFHLG